VTDEVEGVKKIEKCTDVIYGRPLTKLNYLWSSSCGCSSGEDEPLRDTGRTKDANIVVVDSKKVNK
jgi:hypothetical protein